MSGVAGPGPVGGGRKDLASSPAEKAAAEKAIEEHIQPDTAKAGAWADEDTRGAVKAFTAKDGEGWVTSGALKKAHETWAGQVKNLMDRLDAEKGALRGAGTILQNTDFGVGAQTLKIRQLSPLDRF
ncbi:hypothetical protein [Streptomyces flaveolus]|uniref:hypothetical protein n=1 Tax=Streptomyces flaveolus TaxID=67297 RepID=UPI0019857D39|nr:hypothetical protein [Streptomyces flaveolus]GGQ54249.1 hypothetical protein GCM10010216_14480 [Streptomyces flaveolus]